MSLFFLSTQNRASKEENTEVTNTIKVPGPLDDITFEEDQAMNNSTEEPVIFEESPKQQTNESQLILDNWIKYKDPQNRFSFFYPPSFGEISQGTNSGFGNRVASIRFSDFSSGLQDGQLILGGEVVLTKEFISVDIQALGGLYDPISLEAFPETLQDKILANMPVLSEVNFCQEFSKKQHIDFTKPDIASLSQQLKDAIQTLDRTRNIDPNVINCELSGNVITFHKEATIELGRAKNRQHIYGAIRFLSPPFSSFQLIRVTTDAPGKELLQTITSVISSFE